MRWKSSLAILVLAMMVGAAIYFGSLITTAVKVESRLAKARVRFPFVSLSARLPKGQAIRPTRALSAEAQAYWETMDSYHTTSNRVRAEMLKELHEKTRDVFAELPGAGQGRMVWTPDDILMGDFNRDLPQPGQPAGFPLSSGETLAQMKPNENFLDLHRGNVLAFLPPWSFGYFKDREHVAGFNPHGFRYVRNNQQLRVDHVQLIGILSHDRPVVYLTEKLPSMDQIRHNETRSLDPVESAGLQSLRQGEDLHIVSKDDTMRMVGALRATKTCQKCHDAEVGDLLGALSYTLRRPANKTDPEHRKD